MVGWVVTYGFCLWKEVCCEHHISWVNVLRVCKDVVCVFEASRGALVVGLKVLLCIVLGLLFDMIMYLMMVVCLEVILQASILALHPMLAGLSIHCYNVMLFCGVGGRMIFMRVCSSCMSGKVIRIYILSRS